MRNVEFKLATESHGLTQTGWPEDGDGHEKMNYYFDGSAITDYSNIQATIVFFYTNEFYVLLLFDLASGINTRS